MCHFENSPTSTGETEDNVVLTCKQLQCAFLTGEKLQKEVETRYPISDSNESVTVIRAKPKRRFITFVKLTAAILQECVINRRDLSDVRDARTSLSSLKRLTFTIFIEPYYNLRCSSDI